MHRTRLHAVTDEYDSEPGLAVKGANWRQDDFMADRSGTLIAHDVLEHVNGAHNIGYVWDELEALGGVYYVRGQFGDFLQDQPNYHSVETSLASDVTHMFIQWTCEHREPFKRTHALRDNETAEDSFERIISEARNDIPRESDDRMLTRNERRELEAYLDEALHRMRIGYRKARKRFPDAYAAYEQFRAIRDACKPAHLDMYEGAEFVLIWGEGRATCEQIYPEAED